MVWEQILNMKTSPSIANKGDQSMPTLRNPRHERFAQELATGKTADAAYVLAAYRANRSNAARLSANRDIQKRVAEIQSLGAELAAISIETLIAEAEAARTKAMGEKGGIADPTDPPFTEDPPPPLCRPSDPRGVNTARVCNTALERKLLVIPTARLFRQSLAAPQIATPGLGRTLQSP